jgi:hypothetical protein
VRLTSAPYSSRAAFNSAVACDHWRIDKHSARSFGGLRVASEAPWRCDACHRRARAAPASLGLADALRGGAGRGGALAEAGRGGAGRGRCG